MRATYKHIKVIFSSKFFSKTGVTVKLCSLNKGRVVSLPENMECPGEIGMSWRDFLQHPYAVVSVGIFVGQLCFVSIHPA